MSFQINGLSNVTIKHDRVDFIFNNSEKADKFYKDTQKLDTFFKNFCLKSKSSEKQCSFVLNPLRKEEYQEFDSQSIAKKVATNVKSQSSALDQKRVTVLR